VRLCVRHNEPELLKGLSQMPAVVEFKLKDPITLSVFQNHHAMMSDSKEAFGKTGMPLAPQSCCSVYLRAPATDKLPKFAKAGDMLVGSVTFGAKGDSATIGNGQRPGGFPLQVVINSVPAAAAAASSTPSAWCGSTAATKQKIMTDMYLAALKAAPLGDLSQIEEFNGMRCVLCCATLYRSSSLWLT
jgi:hypothetical protein